MKEYKSAIQNFSRRLIGYGKGLYERYAPNLEGLLSLYNESNKRNPYYRARPQEKYNGNFEIPLGTGYPELKPVGSYI